jgi:hypothetical protein
LKPTLGSGEFLFWEYPLAYWIEKQGYDVSYISGVDTHRDGPGLLRSRSFLSVGHDEYWSLEMFNNVREARDAGVNLAFFSGDTCWGVILFLHNGKDEPYRGITRIGQFGPFDEDLVRVFPSIKKLKFNGPSEATLIGARNDAPGMGVADWICTDPEHWLYAGTGMKEGDRIPALVGFEYNGHPADIPGLRVVAKGEIKHAPNYQPAGNYAATIYPGPRDNWVFNASTFWWADGLAEPPGYIRPYHSPNYTLPTDKLKGPDARVQRMTTNLFSKFLGKG